MKIKPLFDRVLCKPIIEHTSEGGIYIPTTNAERHQIMTVVEVGTASPVSINDKIIIPGISCLYIFRQEYFYKFSTFPEHHTIRVFSVR